MAHLPPKSPGSVPNWAPACWVDEFLEFSTAKRNSHRRSTSDSVAFVEESDGGCHELQRLDEEQLMSMFMEEVGAIQQLTEKECTPSDDNSIDDEKMVEQQDAESDCKEDKSPFRLNSEKIADPKRVKR